MIDLITGCVIITWLVAGIVTMIRHDITPPEVVSEPEKHPITTIVYGAILLIFWPLIWFMKR